VNTERLSTFLEVLPSEHRYAFEFREQSWFTEEVYRLLRQHKVALCIYQMTGYDSPHEITADFVYVRFHGTESTYGGSYSDETLWQRAARIREWRKQSKDVYVYFNNDPEATAVRNATTLQAMLSR
jgi:uncharacterized protein YecE (DUF72 family)